MGGPRGPFLIESSPPASAGGVHADTVVVLTINYADWGSDGVIILTRSAPYEKSKSLGSGGSMVARLKLKDIDGRAPPGDPCLVTTQLTPRRRGGEAFELRGLSRPLRRSRRTRNRPFPGLGPQIKWRPVALAGATNDMIGP